MTDLFAPFQLGDLTLTNRLVMAPLTRNRAGAARPPPNSRLSTTASAPLLGSS